MKTPDFEKFFFRLNVFVTVVVFILIVPTTKIFASWYPKDEKVLWLVPVCVITFSALVWLVTNICLPWLFAHGVFDERRQGDQANRYHGLERWRKRVGPIANFIFHMILIAVFCYGAVFLMQSDVISNMVFYKVS